MRPVSGRVAGTAKDDLGIPESEDRSDLVIDFHAHPGFSSGQHLQAECELLLQEARYHRVARVCFNALADWSESPSCASVQAANDAVLTIMSKYTDLVIGFCYVNPRHSRQALREIDRCIGAGMAGIKLWIACRASDNRVDPIAQRAAELGVPILQHAWYNRQGQLAHESTPADVAVMADRNSKTAIVMAHLTGCGERGLADVAPFENVMVDTSGGDPEAGLTEVAVRKLGAHRVIFGSDSPCRSYGASLGKVLGAKLSRRTRELILGGNAVRLLGRRAGL